MRFDEDRSHRLAGRRSGEGHLTLRSEELADGSRAVTVFGEADAAEVLHDAEGLGEEWEMI